MTDDRHDRPPQFSLGGMFVLTLIVATAMGLVSTLPDWAAGIAILAFVPAAPAVLLTTAIFGSRRWSAFSIGAIMPTVMILIAMTFKIASWADEYPSAFPMNGANGRIFPFSYGWMAEFVAIGAKWRVPVVASWVLGALIGILCVVVRSAVSRRGRIEEKL